MPRVSNSSKDHDPSILFFLYIFLAALFGSFLFPFQWISAKLKDLIDSVPDAARLSDRDKLKIWCTVWLVTYPTKEEEERRFSIFKEALTRPTDIDFNRPALADRTPAELEEIRLDTGCSKSHFEGWVKNYKVLGEHRRRCLEEWKALYG
ncbi:hypothetical protein P8452_24163 [Trifolium repens]|nr:hypothetical protein P8452_24163 [Trifolium repens]